MPSQVRLTTLHTALHIRPRTHNHTYYQHIQLQPTATFALTTLMLIAGIVLLFLWSPLMDHRPLKRVSLPSLLSLSLSPGGWCLFACQQRQGEMTLWVTVLPSSSLSCSSSLSPSLSSLSEDCWMMSVLLHDWKIDRGAILAYDLHGGMFLLTSLENF